MPESIYHIDNYTRMPAIASSLDDEALLISFNANGHAAFTNIYNRLFPPVFYFARSIVEYDEALDRTAETFYKLWRMDKHFASIQTIKTWCQVAVRNDCINYLRKQAATRTKENNIVALFDVPELSPEDSMIEAEFLQQIQRAIEKLPPQCKKVFKLAYFEGLREKQIAAQLQISENTVRNHKAQALKFLRISLPLCLIQVAFFNIFYGDV